MDNTNTARDCKNKEIAKKAKASAVPKMSQGRPLVLPVVEEPTLNYSKRPTHDISPG